MSQAPEVALGQLEAIRSPGAGEVRFLGGAFVIRREAVDTEHAIAAGEQRVGERRADEPGNAGDQRAHFATTRRCRG